ncbi:cation:proton antiporter [Sulfitobacter mediterraneus]|jgi:glutathione-regulated potassium-efflux system protein KefB|uniref:cation:proton antiporter domain-containing protein n=1 Tax=Sulfitobacter TaxID=60136 RepID=UPI00193351B0|nr:MULTISPECIES: cation:proton antiporter [Sulfitobacter]MBM1631486.1 cation:proton antiporter [Sulfitobacter mediterraneus]MBM1639301.1 cation:proton antiporter [Sulfitobacter mediterraneus]MBM1643350.1 cation:proton antiporter [Sulfitobacter mediterraneus]MBM1647396.1 cation:proton antiporter [Sulfitobacter mediterraneus]MBM1651441.1 cation:proton antiporter [Sulfitobacter mediterraneus]
MEGFLFQASIYLAAAVIAVPIASRLGLGSVLGYLAAGILIGPVLGLVGAETKDLQHFAEFGVVMMLFLIGLELEPRALWDMRHRLLGLGGLQVALSTAALMGIAMAYDQAWNVALAIGLTLALSSTAIVLQTLSEKNLMQTSGGRSVFSVLLTQDIAVIPILAFLPLLAVDTIGGLLPDGSISLNPEEVEKAHEHGGHSGSEAADAAFSFVQSLPGWGVTLLTIGAVISIIVVGVFFTRPVFRYIHSAKLREMYTALALLIVVGISFVMMLVGLSPALGAFLAGVVLASSEFRHELETDLEPFKGLLLGLFFITVGAGINFELLFADFVIIMGMALLVIIVKGLILYALGWAFKLRGRDQWLFALGLAQAGEFGFVLISFSVATGVMPNGVAETLLLVIALSMLITPLLFILHEMISRRFDESAPFVPDEIDEEGPVIIAGIGRFGQIVNRLLQASGFQTVVLDHNPETIAVMRRFGFKAFLGDPTRPDILRKAGLKDARVLVVALDSPEAALQLITYARKQRPDLHIVSRAHDRTDVYRQYQAGANDIVREMFDSSLRAGRYVLENMGLSEYEAAEAQRMFYAHDRLSVRELAALWRADVEPSQNKAYVERAKELQKDLETAFLNRVDEEDQKRA